MVRGTETKGIRMHAGAIRAQRTMLGHCEELTRDSDRRGASLVLRSGRGIGVVCRA